MRNSDTCQTRRIAAGIMGLLMLIIVLFSSFYLMAEAEHDCAGEDCAICACLRQCENTLRGLSGSTAAHAFVLIPLIFLLSAAAFLAAALPRETLVSQKVRLNN